MFRFYFALTIVLPLACFRSGEADSLSQQSSQRNESAAVLTITSATNVTAFEVEIANTDQSRQRGLMYREHLPNDSGMLFLFDDNRVHSFWMKNTKIPLDLIFFDHEWRVVGFLENMQPYSTQSRSINKPSRYVLEINAGLVKKLDIGIGNIGQLKKGK